MVEERKWYQKHWWIFLVVGILLIFILPLGYMGVLSPSRMIASDEATLGSGYYGKGYYEDQRVAPIPSADFAPDVEERQLIKTSSASIETKRGRFDDAKAQVTNILTAADALVLSDNFQILGTGSQTYKRNTYNIKVETAKYDSVVGQLKQLGEVTSFSETSTDITGAITNRQVEIAAEKERLKRYETLMNRQGDMNSQITIADRIFEQDRRIKYLEDSLTNTQQSVAYSTISLTLQEKQPTYFGVSWVKFSDLIRTLVGSFNALMYFIFAVLPWIAGGFIIYGIVRLVKRWRE